jgi:hypothetical protein
LLWHGDSVLRVEGKMSNNNNYEVVRGGIGRQETTMGGALDSIILGLPTTPTRGIQIGVLRVGETRRIISRRR